MTIFAIIFGVAVASGFLVQAYRVWKVFTLYQLLGDRKRDIDFASLSVWVSSSPTYASWYLGNWYLGSYTREFDDLPEELLKQLPLIRRQVRFAKNLFYVVVAALVTSVLFAWVARSVM